jgi:hypothetical protein
VPIEIMLSITDDHMDASVIEINIPIGTDVKVKYKFVSGDFSGASMVSMETLEQVKGLVIGSKI